MQKGKEKDGEKKIPLAFFPRNQPIDDIYLQGEKVPLYGAPGKDGHVADSARPCLPARQLGHA